MSPKFIYQFCIYCLGPYGAGSGQILWQRVHPEYLAWDAGGARPHPGGDGHVSYWLIQINYYLTLKIVTFKFLLRY